MKKFSLKKLLSIALAAVLVIGIVSIAAWAGGTADVVFDVAAKKFEFNSTSGFYTEDADGNKSFSLFPNLEGLMPGDVKTQTITVKVDNIGANSVEMFLDVKVPNTDEGSNYASLLGTSVGGEPVAKLVVSDANGVLIDAGTLETADKVSLGTFTSGNASKELTVAFDFNSLAGNEFMDMIAHVQWLFVAEVTEPSPVTPPGPEITPDPVPLAKLELDKTNHYGYIVGRGGGGVQPDEYITRAEVATIFFRLLTDASRAEAWMQTNPYSDVPAEEWYNNAISTLTNGEVLEGYEDGSFRPERFITRAEFATMATRFYDEPGVYSVDAFDDIADSWARNYINRAAELGLVDGYGDGTFRPNNYISRAEAMQLTNKILERSAVMESLLPDMITWVDNVDTEIWYFVPVQEATNSHDYEIVTDEDSNRTYEVWTEILPVRDWEAMEKEWSDAYSGIVPGAPESGEER